jgi:hypothetical protein
MAQMGRPPKPTELKRIQGNPGKRALPKETEMILLPAAETIPIPSRPLLKYGQEMWDRIWNMGNSWISPTTDIELVLMTAEMVDERWNLRVKVMGSEDPKMRRGLRELDKMIVSNLSLLGFSPTDRMRLGVAEVKKQSKLEELLAKKAARNA